MAHTYYQNCYHLVWSTKERLPLIPQESKSRLFEYTYGAFKNAECFPIIVGGMTDHIHILTEIPPKLSVSEVIRDIKICTSKWINIGLPINEKFSWQEGFGSFSVSSSKKDVVYQYIQNQELHHKKQTFKDEFLAMLDKHGIEYDPKYLWR
jgi:REP element-mobilizing transposase RayT